jgi:hypothetical protein
MIANLKGASMNKLILLIASTIFSLAANAQKGQPEVFLTCGFSDRSNSSPYIFLYSPKNKVNIFGQVSQSTGKLDDRYVLRLDQATSTEYVFFASDFEKFFMARQTNGNYQGETVTVDRANLQLTLRGNEKDQKSPFYDYGMTMYWRCDILDAVEAKKYIKQMLDDRAERAKNAKPNKI